MSVNDMNIFTQSVSAHLTPIDNCAQQELVSSDHLIISLKEVQLKLMNTNLKKATGPVDLHNWILRHLSCIIAPTISAIINQSIREYKLPSLLN